MEQRDFKGIWIPKEIWLDTRLNALEKIILAEIDSLDCEKTGCYTSNEYLANFCQCSVTKVSTSISKLIKLDYLYQESFNGRNRVLKSRLSKNEKQTFKNENADLKKMNTININDYNNILEELKILKEENNKLKNKLLNKENIIINNNIKESSNKFIKPTIDEIQIYCKEKGYVMDAEYFWNYYESKGWMVGKSKMKSWKSAIANWMKNNFNNQPYNSNYNSNKIQKPSDVEFTEEDYKNFNII